MACMASWLLVGIYRGSLVLHLPTRGSNHAWVFRSHRDASARRWWDAHSGSTRGLVRL